MNDNLLAQLEAVASSTFETFEVGGLTVPLRPVSLFETIRLIRRFPPMKSALYGVVDRLVSQAQTSGEVDVSLGALGLESKTLLSILLDDGPDAIAAFIAISAGSADDPKVEAAIAKLPDDHLIPLAGHVKDVTMPEGIEAFFAGIVGLLMEERAATPRTKPESKKRIRRA